MTREQPIELFMPPNMLKAKVGGSFTGIDLSAVKRAEAAMETLKTEFHDWVSADVAKLNAVRDAFAATPDSDSLGRLHRISFDITGQVQTFDFPLVARIAKSLYEMVAALPDPADIPISLVDAHVNAIRIVFRDNIRNEANPMALELVTELEARVAELTGCTVNAA
jgi:hypothetical protein